MCALLYSICASQAGEALSERSSLGLACLEGRICGSFDTEPLQFHTHHFVHVKQAPCRGCSALNLGLSTLQYTAFLAGTNACWTSL